jgi:UPF0716 family protein affecting phage T7 exclusion
MLFIAIPVVELYILIEVGKKIGSLTTTCLRAGSHRQARTGRSV